MKDFEYTVMDAEGGIYFRTNTKAAAEAYSREWKGIGPNLYIVKNEEMVNFIKQMPRLTGE